MTQHPLQKYMFKSNTKQIQLELSDSSDNKQSTPTSKPKEMQLKLTDLFSNRKKTRFDNQILLSEANNKQQFNPNEHISLKLNGNHIKGQNGKIIIEPTKKLQEHAKNTEEFSHLNSKNQDSLKQYEQIAITKYKQIMDNQNFLEIRNQKLEEERKLSKLKRKQEKAEEQKKKQEEIKKKKSETFKRFLSNIKNKEDGQLNNIVLFNKFQQQCSKQVIEKDEKVGNENNNNPKTNIGLIYKKIATQKQKIPISFLKLLLSYKFSPQYPTQETKKVPNFFEDAVTYKKIFHYLVLNECIADIHFRISDISQKSITAIQVTISNFKKNSDGFIYFNMKEYVKTSNNQLVGQDKQKFMLKSLSLSRNRLGLITNSKYFKIEHYGVPCNKNDRIFSFLCLLVTPQSKEELNSEVKGMCNIEIDNLDFIMKTNKTSRSYFYDLQKISTHIREYLAVSHIEDTEVAQFVYNPLLIEKKHLEMIPEKERKMLEPILNKLKTEYNNTQYESIREMVLRQSGIVLLQGPPGTGKTTTLMGLLAAQYEYLKNIYSEGEKKKILICAPSNAAINHVTKRLVCEGLLTVNQVENNVNIHDGSVENPSRVFPKILRVGIVQTDDQKILSVSLDDICDKKMMEAKSSNIKKNTMTTTQIKEKMVNISKEINKLRNRKDLQEWEVESQITSLKYEIKKFQSLLFNFRKERIELKQTYNQIESKLFEESDIILTTLSSSGSDKMQRLKGLIGCLIVDEAAQSTEPDILIPFQSGVKKILLIGDPFQLPSTTISQDSSITLFNRSLFERFLNNQVKPYFLNIQYRMAPMIREFASKTFYQNRVIDAEDVDKRYTLSVSSFNKSIQQIEYMKMKKKISKISQYFNRNSIFVDVKFGRQEFRNNSYVNEGECFIVKKLLLSLIDKTQLSIGVITPYQSQRKCLLKQLLKQVSQNSLLGQQLQICQEYNTQKQRSIQNSSNNEEDSCAFSQQIELQEGQYEKKNKKEKNKLKIEKEIVDLDCKNEMNVNRSSCKKDRKKKTLQELIQERVMINTVDSFQGQQKDIIIVSTVRSNNKKDIGFMKDERRINVALTRSKHLLIVVGHGDTIGGNETWNKYLDWSQQHKCYYEIRRKEDFTTIFSKLSKGLNEDKIHRIRYSKLSKDIRKVKRQQIRREDFGLGINGQKKIKTDHQHQSDIQSTTLKESVPLKSLEEQQQMLNLDEQRNEQMLHQKRIREEQARKIQEVTKKIKELEDEMMQNEEHPYAKLFLFSSL